MAFVWQYNGFLCCAKVSHSMCCTEVFVFIFYPMHSMQNGLCFRSHFGLFLFVCVTKRIVYTCLLWSSACVLVKRTHSSLICFICQKRCLLDLLSRTENAISTSHTSVLHVYHCLDHSSHAIIPIVHLQRCCN